MDRYATHLQALLDTALSTAGPILELGCGDYSTPVLATIARHQHRRFLVQASDRSWAERYRDLAEVEVIDWTRWSPPAGQWGLVLLDSEESTAWRITRLPALLGVADAIVVHDADAAMTRPHWNECVRGFGIHWYKRYLPWTAVLRPVQC